MPDIDLRIPEIAMDIGEAFDSVSSAADRVRGALSRIPLVYDWHAGGETMDAVHAARVVYAGSTGDVSPISYSNDYTVDCSPPVFAGSDPWIMPAIERIPTVNDCCGYVGAYIPVGYKEEPVKEVSEEEFDDVLEELCG